MQGSAKLLMVFFAFVLAGCASAPKEEPQIKRISAEELEHIMPKPVPNLTMEELVKLSKAGMPAEQIIGKIRESNSRYELTPSQLLDLNRQGVDAKVLDYIHSSREQALRDSFADEINKREQLKKEELDKLERQCRLRSSMYCDPWGYGYSPYYYGPYHPFYYGPGFRYYRRR